MTGSTGGGQPPTRYLVKVNVTLDCTSDVMAGEILRDALSEINQTREVAIDYIHTEVVTRDDDPGDEFEADVSVHVSIIAQGFDEAASFVYSALNPWSQTTPRITSITLSGADVDGKSVY